MDIRAVVPVLQTAIGPMILISAAGLILLSLTNRLARSIDRARELASEGAEGESHKKQVEIIWARARMLRLAILFSTISALCAAILIILLFVIVLFKLNLGWLVAGLFTVSMVSLIASLVFFIREVNHSLTALRLELNS